MKTENSFQVSEITHFYEYDHPADYVFGGHRHRGYELIVLFSGEIERICDEHIAKITKNHFYILPAYSFHYGRSISQEPVKQCVIHFKAPSNLFRSFPAVYEMTEKTSKLFEIFSEDMRKSNNYEYGVCSNVTDTAKKLFEVFLQYSIIFEKEQTEHNSKSIVYQQAFKFMKDNINTKLSVDDIADECLVCKTTLKKIFSQYTGKGCIEFFNEMKLDKAKQLLTEGKNCNEVSDILGFTSQSYFSKKFKKAYGIPPSEVSIEKVDKSF